MPCDCGVAGLNEMFDDRIARREAKRFRKRGLPARARKLLRAIESNVQLSGRTTLEVGAGIGGLTISMLQRGVSRALIVDASPAYVQTARRLADESSVGANLEVQLGNYAESPPPTSVDVVVMDRVVCCYPAWRDLLDNAVQQATLAVALVYPRAAWWSRLGVWTVNQLLRLRKTLFRVYVHSPPLMHELLASNGFVPSVAGHHGPWEIMVARRGHGD